MRYVFLSLFAVLAYTTAMMIEPEQHGYTQSERKSMERLVENALLEPQTKGKWSAARQRDALETLWDN